MKKILICAVALLCGCQQTKNSSVGSNPTTNTKDPYGSYTTNIQNSKNPESFYMAVNSTYTMSYSDNTKQMFIMDGTMEVSNATSNQAIAHTTQHITSGGAESDLEGWYYDGRLYNTYNNVTYYEDMSYQNLEQSLLVPTTIKKFEQSEIESIQMEVDANENRIYTIQLKADSAASIFTSRYDSYGLGSYDGYQISSNKIVDTYDANGYFIGEKADFIAEVSYQGQKISVEYNGSVNYLNLDSTTVTLADDLKSTQSAYVNYQDIDVNAITTEPLIDDAAEATVEETFKKRLVGRLEYTDNGDGTYTTTFNENQSYTVDFNTKVFKYTNYSIVYSYSWKGDTGSMGACTLVFDTNASSSDCQDTTLDTIKETKVFLEMELYYCGLSVDDLIAESK